MAAAPLPEKIPVCPHCGAGGDDAMFGLVELVTVVEHIRAYAENGHSTWEYVGTCSEPEWEKARPVKDVFPHEKQYYCYECGKDFDEFRMASREEAAWRQMMERRR